MVNSTMIVVWVPQVLVYWCTRKPSWGSQIRCDFIHDEQGWFTLELKVIK